MLGGTATAKATVGGRRNEIGRVGYGRLHSEGPVGRSRLGWLLVWHQQPRLKQKRQVVQQW